MTWTFDRVWELFIYFAAVAIFSRLRIGDESCTYRMNHCVPDFETDEDYSIPASNSGLMRPKKSVMGGDEDIMELLWQNGQLVVQSQNQRSGGNNNKPHNGDLIEQAPPFSREIRSAAEVEETTPSHLFMQEEEMASWLHYPMDDSSFDRYLYSDLLYPPPVSAPVSLPPTSAVTVAPRPPIPPSRRVEPEPPTKYQNIVHFSRPRTTRIDSVGPSTSNKTPAAKDLTVVDSNETPPAANGPESRVSRVADSAAPVYGGNNFLSGTTSGIDGAAGTSSLARDIDMCELTVTSSPGTGSGASASAKQSSQMPAAMATVTGGDRKRKGMEADATTTTDCHSEDLDFECTDEKKQARGSTSAKRSRAAEVHNLSERRRRDRINEKMKALQELIPRCNKSDKASMLDEAIEYLKSLQMQVQMMSMGCSMVPMMFPGVQQYMSPMAMGMGMGMDMSMNRTMVPYPSVLPGSAMPASAAATAHLAPRFPVPAFQMPSVPVADPTRIGPANGSDPRMNSYLPQNPNQVRMPSFVDPYQHYLSLQQTQVPLPQVQALMQPCTAKASRSKGANPEHQQAG